MRCRVLLSFCVACLFSSAAAADWIAQRQIDEFDQKHRFIAASSASVPALYFVCEAETGRMKLLYKTSEKASASLRSALPSPARAYFIVDNQPVRSYPGKLAHIEKKLVFESYDDGAVALLKVIGAAERRVLVAVELFGQKYFQAELPVAGSAKHIKLVTDECAKYRK